MNRARRFLQEMEPEVIWAIIAVARDLRGPRRFDAMAAMVERQKAASKLAAVFAPVRHSFLINVGLGRISRRRGLHLHRRDQCRPHHPGRRPLCLVRYASDASAAREELTATPINLSSVQQFFGLVAPLSGTDGQVVEIQFWRAISMRNGSRSNIAITPQPATWKGP